MHYRHFARKPKDVGVVSVQYVTIWPTPVLQKWACPNMTKHLCPQLREPWLRHCRVIQTNEFQRQLVKENVRDYLKTTKFKHFVEAV